ncbi:MAG: OB-fold nucleic acid binding domain-containing protein, partial [Pseudomonadota bacterium]
AHLVYVSSWLKCHFPAAFAAALLNSQPMGFYAPAQIVRDAREHGVEVLPADVNESEWDNTLENLRASDADPTATSADDVDASLVVPPACGRGVELGEPEVSLGGAGWAERDKGRLDKHIALRLGLRQVDGFPEHVAAQLIAEREERGRYRDVAELRERAGLSPSHVERLASADCFTSMQLSRRQALWDARSLIAASDLPLFKAAAEREEGAERTSIALPEMPLSEEVVADYQTTRLSLKAHPMSFLRPALAERGFVRACDLRDRKFRSMVQVAGVVLIRQRPGSAKGVCFITLEDETGVINLVIWPDLKEKQRKVVMGARLMEVRGRVEYDDEVIHVIAQHMTDATDGLYALSDDMLNAPVARADHVSSPITSHKMPPAKDAVRPREIIDELSPGSLNGDIKPNVTGHPRNHRIIPKSRDFH